MKVEEKKSSGLPLVIILGVLILALVGAYWLYNSSANNGRGGPKNPTQTPSTTANPNASQGATPPNMLGSPTASVTLEEFADFQCPSCGDKHPVMKQIQSLYGSRIKFIFRHFPLQMHDKAYDAAVAAEAAGMQGKFWDMHNQLYTNQKTWSNDPNYKQLFISYAEKIGLDVEKFKNDMAGIATKMRVDADLQRGRGMNINQTPTLFINNKSVPYPEMTVDTLKQLIDAEMQATAAANRPANVAAQAGAAAPANANAEQK
jgi:protein-disulfide isomerase